MRIAHRYFHFDDSPRLFKELRRILDKYNVSYKYVDDKDCVIDSFRYSIDFTIFTDSPKFEFLKDELNHFSIEPQIGTVYEKEDHDAADWFIILKGEYQYPQPEDGYMEATFDVTNYCIQCGMGAVQSGTAGEYAVEVTFCCEREQRRFFRIYYDFYDLRCFNPKALFKSEANLLDHNGS